MARYLFASQNKITENKNRKEFRKNLPVARAKPAHPAQQAQRGTGVFFPVPRLQAARWNATERAEDDTSPPCASRPPRGLLLTPGDAALPSASISPSRASSSSSCVQFHHHSRAPPFTVARTRGHRRQGVQPRCPSPPPSSTSSSWSKRNRDLDSSHRNRPRALA